MSLSSRIATVVMIIGCVMALSSAGASAQPSNCRTFTHRYFLGSGSAITVRIGYVDTAIRICTDGRERITSADAWQTTGATGPGTLAGFVVEPGLAVITDQTPARAIARYDGRIRICVAQRTSICSESSDYTIIGGFTGSSFIGPTVEEREKPFWDHAREGTGGVHYYGDA